MGKANLSSIDDNGEAGPGDLYEIPTPHFPSIQSSGERWPLDFRRASLRVARQNPEVQRAEHLARLGRIDAERDRDPWADSTGDVASISRQVNVLASNVDIPADATHKIVGGLFADSYATAPRVTEDGKAFYVVMVSGSRKGMMTRVDFDQFVTVDGKQDEKLRGLLNVEARGKPRTSMGANNLRKK